MAKTKRYVSDCLVGQSFHMIYDPILNTGVIGCIGYLEYLGTLLARSLQYRHISHNEKWYHISKYSPREPEESPALRAK